MPVLYHGMRVICPLPMGEVAEDGEGEEQGVIALSVTCGDSSPRGRAKGLYPVKLLGGLFYSSPRFCFHFKMRVTEAFRASKSMRPSSTALSTALYCSA